MSFFGDHVQVGNRPTGHISIANKGVRRFHQLNVGTLVISDNDFSVDPQNRRDLCFGGILGMEYQAIIDDLNRPPQNDMLPSPRS